MPTASRIAPRWPTCSKEEADLFARISRAVRRRVRCWRALREARDVTRRRLEAGPLRRVLVVCYGNIYRSPYVGEYLRQRAGKTLEVRTAGFHSKTGRESPAEHVAMCERRGVSLAAHRSSRVDADMLDWADTIVFMDRKNWIALDEAGADHDRFVWLGALDGGPLEIPDPYGLPPEDAERIVARLTAAANQLLDRAMRGARQ